MRLAPLAMNHFRIGIVGGALVLAASAALAAGRSPAVEANSKADSGSRSVFSLLPKSLQKNPRLDFNIITEINQQGTTVLLVEQNAQQALSRAHRAYVLETGRIVKSGTGQELLTDPSVKEAYLGVA